MFYASITDLEIRAGKETIIELTDDSKEATGELQPEKAEAAIQDACAEMDSYIALRYILPLPSVPTVLVRCCCDIAYYRLQEMRPLGDIEDSRKRYDDAMKWLRDLSIGKAVLGADFPLIGEAGNHTTASDGMDGLEDGSMTHANTTIAVNAMPKIFTGEFWSRMNGIDPNRY